MLFRSDVDGVTVETSKDSISGLKGNLLFNISGDSNINVKGNCNITSTGNNNFQAVKNNINGDVSITGNLTTTGKVTAPSSEILSMSSTAITTTTASIGGISIDNVSAELITKHVHTAPSGGGITSGPTPQ